MPERPHPLSPGRSPRDRSDVYLTTNHAGHWMMRITMHNGAKMSGQRVKFSLRTTDKATAIMRRNACIKRLYEQGRIDDHVYARARAFECIAD